MKLPIQKSAENPKYLFRKSDGFRFTRQSNGKYTMDKTLMNPPGQWDFEALDNKCFVKSLKQCKIEKYKNNNDGHGNGDFDE